MDITDHGAGIRVVQLGDGLNAVDDGFLDALGETLDRVEGDADATALVTTGSGKHYSNGFDLEFLGGLEQTAAAAFLDRTATTLARILTFPLPTVAAINGHAFGAGAMLVLAHDLRAQNAERGWFCLPEIDLGLQFAPFQLALITSRLTTATVEEAILSGRRYDGAASLAAGIVHAVATPDKLVTTAAELTTPYTGKPRSITQSLKRQLHAPTLTHLPT
jgi:enoyl-CoA hydratase/carnithine racemase